MTEAQARQAAKSGEGAGMSAPLVLIPLGAEFLALTPAELAQARERALAILGGGWAGDRAAAAAAQSPEELLTAQQMEAATQDPVGVVSGICQAPRDPVREAR